jgi:hypothetical protein
MPLFADCRYHLCVCCGACVDQPGPPPVPTRKRQDCTEEETLSVLLCVMSFSYVLPTTGAFSFTAFISSPPARLHGALAEAAAQRGRLRDILKRLKRADDKDTLAVIKVLILVCLAKVDY